MGTFDTEIEPSKQDRRSSDRRGLRATVVTIIIAASWVNAVRVYAKLVASGGGPYQTADWLINYEAGFVRRGLFGHIYFHSFPPGQTGLWILFGIQMLLGTIPIILAFRWLRVNDFEWPAVAIVCNPAAFLFVGWDPAGFARKESLTLAAMALLASVTHPQREELVRKIVITLSLALYVLAVPSWEASAFLLPGMLFLLRHATRPQAGQRLWVLLAGFTSAYAIAGLLTSAVWHGDTLAANRICTSLRLKFLSGPGLCDGAIAAIGWTSDYTMQTVKDSYPLYFGYFPFVVLALLPLLATDWLRRNWMLGLSCAFAIAPLYLVVNDYGRWTYMLIAELTICLIASRPTLGSRRPWGAITTLTYVLTWGMPNCLSPGSSWPWLGFLALVRKLALFIASHTGLH